MVVDEVVGERRGPVIVVLHVDAGDVVVDDVAGDGALAPVPHVHARAEVAVDPGVLQGPPGVHHHARGVPPALHSPEHRAGAVEPRRVVVGLVGEVLARPPQLEPRRVGPGQVVVRLPRVRRCRVLDVEPPGVVPRDVARDLEVLGDDRQPRGRVVVDQVVLDDHVRAGVLQIDSVLVPPLDVVGLVAHHRGVESPREHPEVLIPVARRVAGVPVEDVVPDHRPAGGSVHDGQSGAGVLEHPRVLQGEQRRAVRQVDSVQGPRHRQVRQGHRVRVGQLEDVLSRPRVVAIEEGFAAVVGSLDPHPLVLDPDNDIGREVVRAGVHINGVAGVEVVGAEHRGDGRHGVGGRRPGIGIVPGGGEGPLVAGVKGVVHVVVVAGGARRSPDREHGVRGVPDVWSQRVRHADPGLQRAPCRVPGEVAVVQLGAGDVRVRGPPVQAHLDVHEVAEAGAPPVNDDRVVQVVLFEAIGGEELDERLGRSGRLIGVAVGAEVDARAVLIGEGAGRWSILRDDVGHIAGVDGGRVEGVGLPEPAVMAGDRGGQVEVVVRARRGGGGVVPQHEVGGRHPSRARGGRLLRPEQPARPIRRRPLQARRRDVTVVHHLELEGHPARRRRRVHRPPLRGEVHDGHGRQRRDQIVHVQLLRPVRAEVEGVVPCLGQVDLPAPAEGRAVVGQSPEPAVVHEVHHAVHDPRDRGGAAPRLVREALEAEPAELLEPPHPVRPGLGHEPRVRCQRVLIEPQLVPPVGQRPELLLPEAQLGPVGEVEVVVVAGEADLGGVGHVEGVVPRPAGP